MRQSELPIHDDPHRRSRHQPWQSTGQLRVIGERGAGPDEHRVVLGAEQMDAFARHFAGDPAAFAARRGDAAVERGRQLEGHQRPAGAHPLKKAGVQLRRFRRTHSGLDRQPGRAQPGQAGAGDTRVRILHGGNDPAEPGGDQRIGAGRGLAPMTARFQRHIGRAPACRDACARQRLGLGMRAPARLGPAAADDMPVLDDHTANRRVRPDIAKATPGEPQRCPHHPRVVSNFGHSRKPGTGPPASGREPARRRRSLRSSRRLNRHPPRSGRQTRRNLSLRGNCGKPRQTGYKRPDRGSTALP